MSNIEPTVNAQKRMPSTTLKLHLAKRRFTLGQALLLAAAALQLSMIKFVNLLESTAPEDCTTPLQLKEFLQKTGNATIYARWWSDYAEWTVRVHRPDNSMWCAAVETVLMIAAGSNRNARFSAGIFLLLVPVIWRSANMFGVIEGQCNNSDLDCPAWPRNVVLRACPNMPPFTPSLASSFCPIPDWYANDNGICESRLRDVPDWQSCFIWGCTQSVTSIRYVANIIFLIVALGAAYVALMFSEIGSVYNTALQWWVRDERQKLEG
jgi:hypothetical protein